MRIILFLLGLTAWAWGLLEVLVATINIMPGLTLLLIGSVLVGSAAIIDEMIEVKIAIKSAKEVKSKEESPTT